MIASPIIVSLRILIRVKMILLCVYEKSPSLKIEKPLRPLY